MKLFDKTPIKDSWEWGIDIPDVDDMDNDINSIVYYLADGFGLASYNGRDFLIKSKRMEDLDVDDINTIIQSHGIDFWQDTKYISVYETNLNFGKFDKWLN